MSCGQCLWGTQNMPSHLRKELQPCFSCMVVSVIFIRTPEMVNSYMLCIFLNIMCIVVTPVMYHRRDLSAACPWLLLFGSCSPTVLLQPLPKWLGPVGAVYWRLARLVVKVEQPCPSHTAVPDQSDQDIPIMSRLELKFAGWDQIFGSLVEKVHSLTPVNTGLSGP